MGNFETDRATYYAMDVATDLAFLPYPNRLYRYYVDGGEVEPVIEDMRAYIPVGKGKHRIEVKYVNYLGQLCNVVYLSYFVLVAAAILLYAGNAVSKRRHLFRASEKFHK